MYPASGQLKVATMLTHELKARGSKQRPIQILQYPFPEKTITLFIP
jgi:hypothetical protein